MAKKGVGLLSWSSRGQYGIEGWISAATGYRMPKKAGYFDEMSKVFHGDKTINYVVQRLTTANRIAKKGGHVIMHRNDQVFRLHFDNRRVIQEIEPGSV